MKKLFEYRARRLTIGIESTSILQTPEHLASQAAAPESGRTFLLIMI
jgi:hypothetical protein